MAPSLPLSIMYNIQRRDALDRSRLQAAGFAGIMLSAFLLFTICACYCQARQRHQQREDRSHEQHDDSAELLEESWVKPPPEDEYEPLPAYTLNDTNAPS